VIFSTKQQHLHILCTFPGFDEMPWLADRQPVS